MRLKILPIWLAVLCFTACGDAGNTDSLPADTDTDTQDTLAQNDVADSESEIAVPDSEDIPDTPDVDEPIEPTPSALILDFDMSPSIAWYTVMESLQQQGFQVTYRRWFPHTVLSDTEGQSAYSMILVAAGQGPSHPTEIMRVDDAKRLTAYVQGGGTLVLLPRNTWQDASVSDAAWLHMNRILEGVDLPLRIQRNTVVGSVSTDNPPKAPLHITTQAAYPGALEWTINLPVGYAATEHPAFTENPIAFAAGYVPTLACDSDDMAILATVHQDSILWNHHGPEGIEFPEAAPPVAALSPAGNGGWLAVIPRSFATLSSYSGTPGDRPILFLDLLNRLDTNMDFFLKHIVEVQNEGAKHTPQGCHAGPIPLFSATAPNMPTLGSGPPQKALHAPISRPISETLPSPPAWADDLVAHYPKLSNPPPVAPPWFTHERAHLGYGGLSANHPLQPLVDIGAEHGLDSLVITVEPAFLRLYTPQPDEPPAFQNAAELAEQKGMKLFLGAHYRHSHWESLKSLLGPTLGAQKQTLDAPPPLADIWWDEGIRPLIIGAAMASVDYPGIGGISIDLELYGAGALWYEDGHAFDVFSFKHILDKLTLFDESLATELEGLSPMEYMPWLIENGLLRFAYQSLEDAVAEKATQLRSDALAINPDFKIALYAPLIPMSWFYRGLMRAFGDKEHPVTVLSYDAAPNRLRNRLKNEKIHIRALSGVLGVLFHPIDFKYAMLNAGARSDGYWLFQLSDFPDTEDPDVIKTKNGPPLEYWKQLKAANAELDLLPLQ